MNGQVKVFLGDTLVIQSLAHVSLSDCIPLIDRGWRRKERWFLGTGHWKMWSRSRRNMKTDGFLKPEETLRWENTDTFALLDI